MDGPSLDLALAPPPRAAPGPPAPAAQTEAEPSPRPTQLSPREEAAVARVAGRAKLWGMLCVAIGGVQVAASLYSRQAAGMISYLPAGAVAILVGLASLSVGQALYAVNRPGGDGVHKLLIAVDAVGIALLVQIVTTVVGVLFAAIAVGLQMIAAR